MRMSFTRVGCIDFVPGHGARVAVRVYVTFLDRQCLAVDVTDRALLQLRYYNSRERRRFLVDIRSTGVNGLINDIGDRKLGRITSRSERVIRE
jgi:hypothetical protein